MISLGPLYTNDNEQDCLTNAHISQPVITISLSQLSRTARPFDIMISVVKEVDPEI